MTAYPERIRKALERARAQLSSGGIQAALLDLQKVVTKVPKGEEGWMLLGRAHSLGGAHSEALKCFERVARINPKNPVAWFNQGVAHAAMRRYGDATTAYAAAIQHAAGDYPDALRNIAWCFIQLDQYELALQALEAYLCEFPPSGEVYELMGIAQQGRHDSVAAAEAYRKALKMGVRDYTLHLNLGSCLHASHDYFAAAEHAGQALALQRDDPVALFNLGTAEFALGEIEKARETFARVPRPEAPISRLAALSYLDPLDMDRLVAEHAAWGNHLAATCARQPDFARSMPIATVGRRLRLGFVSPDFREHPVAFFIEGLFRHIDRERFELFLYFDSPNRDDVTTRFEALADHWVELEAIRDHDLAASRIRQDQIDILFDLAGLTSSRIEMFGRRIAPVQASYLGYASTTGLPTMDYVLSDVILDPAGATESHYAERLIRLGSCLATYSPPLDAPPPADRPMKRVGHPRLASVARLNKISNGTLDAWSDALREVPEARMLVIAHGLQNPMIQARLQERFRQRGIAPERIDLRGGVGIGEYFALHSQIDLFLDTTPWSGHTTTLHGLWMGVPTVTFERAHHAGRFTTMVMRNAGLPEFIAADAASFGARVRRVLHDDALMEQVRTRGREILCGSPLMDHAGLARRFQGACDEMWRSCSGETPAPVQAGPAAGNR